MGTAPAYCCSSCAREDAAQSRAEVEHCHPKEDVGSPFPAKRKVPRSPDVFALVDLCSKPLHESISPRELSTEGSPRPTDALTCQVVDSPYPLGPWDSIEGTTSCVGDADDEDWQVVGRDGGARGQREMTAASDGERSSPVSSWAVCRHDGAWVRQLMDDASAAIGKLEYASLVQGRPRGDWIELSDQPGFVNITSKGLELLRPAPIARWHVVWHDGVNVREHMDADARVLRILKSGSVVNGRARGDWVQLTEQVGSQSEVQGFVRHTTVAGQLLLERTEEDPLERSRLCDGHAAQGASMAGIATAGGVSDALQADTADALPPGVEEWEVVWREGGVRVRRDMDVASDELRICVCGTKVRGMRRGDWLELHGSEGFMSIRNGAHALLRLASELGQACDWLVVWPEGVRIRSAMDCDALSYGIRAGGAIVRGISRPDDWVELSREPGFMRSANGTLELLRPVPDAGSWGKWRVAWVEGVHLRKTMVDDAEVLRVLPHGAILRGRRRGTWLELEEVGCAKIATATGDALLSPAA